MLGFDWTSVLAVVLYIGTLAGAVLAIGALAGKLRSALRSALRPRRPDVMLGHPSVTTRHELDRKTGERRLIWAEPGYRLENKDEGSIYDVTTGLRARDGEGDEYPLAAFRAQIFEGKTKQEVANAGTLPLVPDLPANPVEGFLFWVRFRDGADRWWEVVYDPVARTTSLRAAPRSPTTVALMWHKRRSCATIAPIRADSAGKRTGGARLHESRKRLNRAGLLRDRADAAPASDPFAMQKVVGSSPIIRSSFSLRRAPGTGCFVGGLATGAQQYKRNCKHRDERRGLKLLETRQIPLESLLREFLLEHSGLHELLSLGLAFSSWGRTRGGRPSMIVDARRS